jgi:hypothetical protein
MTAGTDQSSWLPAWCAADEVQIRAEYERGMAVTAASAGSDVFMFANGVCTTISWALSPSGSPAPTRGPKLLGPASGAMDVCRERDLTRSAVGHIRRRLRPFGEGVIACCEWLLGESSQIVYPADTPA